MKLPDGFLFNGLACGIKRSGKPDLALVACPEPAVAAGVYTQNVVRAASIDWNRRITPTDRFRAVIVNSGNANACTGQQGIRDNESLAAQTAAQLQASADQVAVLSTGVIGHPLPMPRILPHLGTLVSSAGNQQADFERAAQAILTTDQGIKMAGGQLEDGPQGITAVGMAKGAGMIGPNMATLLAIVCTDAALTPATAQQLVQTAADHSFNRISVEGHTSTNDALLLIGSGTAGPVPVEVLQPLVNQVCLNLAKMIPADGEGATSLVQVDVLGAASQEDADRVARAVASSNLVKTAIAGADPNWGRIVSAAGYAGAAMELEATRLEINGNPVFAAGEPVGFDAAAVSRSIRDQDEVLLALTIGRGGFQATHWTSDLTVDYVRFNSEYTT